MVGYHGCDQRFAETVLGGKNDLDPSTNHWDWLGTGIYFWENDKRRALNWAESAKKNPKLGHAKIRSPFALGAVIDLGNCLDLLEAESICIVDSAHKQLVEVFEKTGIAPPANRGKENVVRSLDCAVINYVHDMQKRANSEAFDSVRAAFVEGQPLYKNAGFHSRTHIQICIRQSSSIIGYFRPRR